MKQIVLNPKYEALRPFLEELETHFARGRSLRERRNVLRVCRYGGFELNVKRFHAPALAQRLVYKFLRQPKARRAYRNAFLIRAAGVETPESVAYVEHRRHGLLLESYYVSLQCPYKRRFYEFGTADVTPEVRDIAEHFARLTARLHEAGLLHKDYSPGNILFDRGADGAWHFSLVDTNRLRRGRVSVRRGCENFARLWGQPEFFDVLADAYAAARGADAARCRRWVRAARRRFWTRYVRRHGEKFPLRF